MPFFPPPFPCPTPPQPLPFQAPPPPPHFAPPPPPHFSPPPPHFSPPPPHPFPPVIPPPPHVVPPPPSPHHHTVIIIVVVSIGGLFLLAALAALPFWCIRKKREVQKAEIINVEDHVHVTEAVIPGPHGQKVEVLSIDEDLKYQEVFKKDQKVGSTSNAGVESKRPHIDGGSESRGMNIEQMT